MQKIKIAIKEWSLWTLLTGAISVFSDNSMICLPTKTTIFVMTQDHKKNLLALAGASKKFLKANPF